MNCDEMLGAWGWRLHEQKHSILEQNQMLKQLWNTADYHKNNTMHWYKDICETLVNNKLASEEKGTGEIW